MPTQAELNLIGNNLKQIRYKYNDQKQKVILEDCQPFAQFVSDRYDIFRDNFHIFAKNILTKNKKEHYFINNVPIL